MKDNIEFGFGIYDDFFRKDSEEPETWITTKGGTHIPLDENGNPMNKVGKEIMGQNKERKVNTHNPNRDYGSFKTSPTNAKSTLAKYSKNGQLTPERQRLHQEIIDSLLDGIPKPKGQPTATFLGGGPASGKSSITRDSDISTPDESETVCIDSDRIKNKIPEYIDELKKGNADAADIAHEESSYIAWKAFSIAQKEGYNCMMDGTGNGSVESMLESIREAKANGQKVIGKYCTCDTEEAVRRATERSRTSEDSKGRVVPEAYIRKVHKSVSAILPQIAKEFDDVELYCTDAGKKPRLIAKGGNGKTLKAVDSNLYDQFVQKQYEEIPDHLRDDLS